MPFDRRRILQLALAAAAVPAVARSAAALDYPNRPVRLIVGYNPGTAPDITARLIGQWLSDRLGQQFVTENKPGAGTELSTEAVVRAAPDGYTLLTVATPNMAEGRRSETAPVPKTRDHAQISTYHSGGVFSV